jgi:hypothetical protein
MKLSMRRFGYLLATVTLLAIVGVSRPFRDLYQPGPVIDRNTSVTDPLSFDRYHIRDGLRTVVVDNTLKSTASASLILHRQRKSQYFVYMNLRELYLEDLNVQLFYSTNQPVELFNDLRNALLDDIRTEEAHGQDFQRPEDIETSRAIDETFLTRVYVQGMRELSLNFPDDMRFRIASRIALANLVDGTIRFSDDVSVEDANGIHLEARYAVWVKKLNGILFPDGYRSIDEHSERNYPAGFFTVSSQGDLCASASMPAINIEPDMVERMDNALREKLLERLGISPERQ